MMLDISAPIVPFDGFGEIKLYSTRDELIELLEMEGVKSKTIFNAWIQYDIQDSVRLLFHLKNNKLFLIRTLDNYRGKVFGTISVGIKEEEILKLELSFVYDEFEEVWESNKGVIVETDAETNKVRWISVFVREMYSEGFEEGRW